MKATAPLLLLFAGLVIAENYKLNPDITTEKLQPIKVTDEVLPAISWNLFKEILLLTGQLEDGHIQADVTEYAKKVLEYVQTFIVKKGLEPLVLSDQKIKLVPTGTCTLTNGTLNNLSSISLSDSVIVKYSHNGEIMEVTLPLAFESLSIDYKYRTKITLLSVKGGVQAKIKNVKLNLHLGFNFTSFYAFVDKADVRDSGSISLEFSGQGIADWVIDLLAGVLTTLFHGIILNVVNDIIDTPVEGVVDSINNLIDTLLLRNTSIY
ncbi:unnamed protein product [Ceutorhynchus assimilis]|uniref:Uncharacterized protein n=1 Tax=Ceutorhynchus assimilis TaxID=467358 RepID=A0A9N9QQH1_9CUCU|nr:unnamed protein product [Ceutorhynchus assimilis]